MTNFLHQILNLSQFKIMAIIGLIIYFTILLTIVIRDNKRGADGVKNYFFASQSLPFWMLSLTFIASWWGAGSAIEMADNAYKEGIGAFWIYGMPVLFSTFLMILMSKIIRKVNCATQAEMLELRYGKFSALICSIIILLFMVFTAASQMVGIGLFFKNYLNIDYGYAVILGTLVVVIYSLFGGFRGVVFTDIVQFFFLTATVITIVVTMFYAGGSFSKVSEIVANNPKKANYFSFGAGAKNYMIYFITFGAAWMIQANVWQRIQATKSIKDARRMTTFSFFVYIPLYLLAILTGMLGLSLYSELPKGGIVINVINDHMHPAISALAFIGLTSAIMSTMDSLINTGSLIFTKDIYKKHINKNASEKHQLRIAMLATLFISIAGIFISLQIKSILDIAWIAADIIATGIFFPLILGFFFRAGNNYGTIFSMIFSLIYVFYHLLIQFKVPHRLFTLFYDIPFEKVPDNLFIMWKLKSATQVCVGMTSSFLIYIIISLVTKRQYDKADKFMLRAGTNDFFKFHNNFLLPKKILVFLKVPFNKEK